MIGANGSDTLDSIRFNSVQLNSIKFKWKGRDTGCVFTRESPLHSFLVEIKFDTQHPKMVSYEDYYTATHTP